MGKYAVLLVADPYLVVPMAFRQIGDDAHLACCRVSRCCAMGLERDGDDRVCGIPVRVEIGVHEGAERRIALQRRFERADRRLLVVRLQEHRADVPQDHLVDAAEDLALDPEAFLDTSAENVDPELAHRNLDTRLVLVIAAPADVVDLQDGLDVGKQVGFGQELANHRSDNRRASEPAANADTVADLSGAIADHAQANVVGAGDGPVDR